MHSLENLLLLDGEVFPMDNGYWVKFEAKQVEQNSHRPHGVRYSFTLHDKNNQRVVGFDNAHSFKLKAGKYRAKKESYDHIHKKMEIFPYEFGNAEELICDFWGEVEKYIENN